MNRVIAVTQVAERNNKSTTTKSLGLNSTSVSSSDPTKSSLLRQPNAGVGIIGGVSADVTVDFVNKLVKWSNEGKDNGNRLPNVLCSDLVLSNSCQLSNDAQIVEILGHKRALEAKLKPIEAGSPVRIGVLATNAILNALETGIGFEVILPDKATMEHTIIPSTKAKSQKDIEGAQNLLRIAIHVVLLRAVNTIILASDDLRDIFPYDDPLLKKCVDPLDSLASWEAKLKPNCSWKSCCELKFLPPMAILNAGILSRQTSEEGFEVILPDKATMEHMIIPSTKAKSQKDIEGAQNLLRIAIHVVLLRAVNTIILSSDDLRDIFPYDDPLLKKCVDPLDSLARSTVKLAQSAIQSF
ncbi:probable amino-acid racemase [Tanacetum coccineum]